MSLPDYEAFFRAYAKAYERSLGSTVDSEAIRGCFAEGFVAASTTGQVVRAGQNDEAFERGLEQSYAFYRRIGTRGMDVERVHVEPLCQGHDKVCVDYCATYERPDGSSLTIRFDIVYLMQRRDDGPKIFAFVAGDEMALFKRHGLLGEAELTGKEAGAAARSG